MKKILSALLMLTMLFALCACGSSAEAAYDKAGIDTSADGETEVDPLLEEGSWFFPSDMITDMPERTIAAEVIREKLLRLLDQEVPHGTAVTIEDFKESDGRLDIRAEIFCEKAGHKRIIIGKDGKIRPAGNFGKPVRRVNRNKKRS